MCVCVRVHVCVQGSVLCPQHTLENPLKKTRNPGLSPLEKKKFRLRRAKNMISHSPRRPTPAREFIYEIEEKKKKKPEILVWKKRSRLRRVKSMVSPTLWKFPGG